LTHSLNHAAQQPHALIGLPRYGAGAAGGVSTCSAADTYTSGAFQLIATSLLA
jgi:hypothetical protein